MQNQPLRVQKLFRIYKLYVDKRKRGHLCTIHSLMNFDDVKTWLNDNNDIGRTLDEKLYLIYNHIHDIEICHVCGLFKKFTLKNEYEISGSIHRRCKKFPFSKVFTDYTQFYGIDEFKKITYNLFIKKPEIIGLINKWKLDHPLFENYNNRYILPLFSYVENENDLDDIPICKYCNKFKCSINYNIFMNDKLIHFNDYCFSCAEIYRGETFKISARRLHGVDNYSQLQSVKDKKVVTCNKNYGVDNPMQVDSLKMNHINTCRSTYGVDNVSQIPEVKEKKMTTILDNFDTIYNYIDYTFGEYCRSMGVDNASQLDFVKDKKIQTFLKNYGVTNIFTSTEFKEISENTCKERYGAKNWSQSFEGRKFLRECALVRIETQLLNGEPVFPTVGTFERPCLNYISKELGFNIIRNARCIGYFPDGFIPEYSLIIEFDERHHFIDHYDTYHSKDIKKNEDYHHIGLNLFRIKKNEWLHDKQPIMHSLIDLLPTLFNNNNVYIEFKNKNYHIMVREV